MNQQGSKPASHHPLARLERGARLTLALLVLLPASVLAAQQGGRNQNFPGAQNFPGPQMPDPMAPLDRNPITTQMQLKRLNAMNADRQKSLVADTNKLLKLTADLNAQINGSHPTSLSEAQLRMVAEIEKLAHNIREKMCVSVNGAPRLGPSPSFIPPSPIP